MYASQLEFLAMRREDIRRRHAAATRAILQAQDEAMLLAELTDRYVYTAAPKKPPLPGQHEASLSAAFRSLRRAEGLSNEDVVLDPQNGNCSVVRTEADVRNFVRGGWFECDDEFWADARGA